MAKKHKDRPAFYGKDVFAALEAKPPAWLEKIGRRSLLEAVPIGQTGVFVAIKWGYVWQRWLKLNNPKKPEEGFKVKSALTYVPKGTILVPRFVEIPDWEIKVLQSSEVPLEDLGIRLWIDIYNRLILIQDPDLEKAIRQQKHIKDNYKEIPKSSTRKFSDYFRAIAVSFIVSRVERRQNRLEAARQHIEIELEHLKNSLPTIIEKSPAFTGQDMDGKHKFSALRAFESAIRKCEEFPMRPVGKNMLWASRFLKIAIISLENDDIERSKKFVEKAIAKMVYPREEKPTTTATPP